MVPSALTIVAPAKINLQFAIIGKRADGYHEVQTVMQKITLADQLHFARASNFFLNCSDSGLPADETNIVAKAARSFFALLQEAPQASIYLEKKIPIAAGLGGGSSDAAACLIGLDQLFGTELSNDQLMDLARPLGADVPFFLADWPSTFATGIGNELLAIEPVGPCWIVLVNPGISVSTKWAYDNFTLTRDGKQYKLGDSKISAEGFSCFSAPSKADGTRVFNDLEAVTVKNYPVIQEIKETFLKLGASTSLMSGSGATVFGIFEQREVARKCSDYFARSYSAVFLTQPIRDVRKR